MGNLKKYGRHPIVTISWMLTEVFSVAKKGGHATCFFENLSKTFNKIIPKTYDNPPFVATETHLPSEKYDNRMVTKNSWSQIFGPILVTLLRSPQRWAIEKNSITSKMGY
jgi:hypothetical protein